MNFVKRMKRGIAAVLAFLMAMAGGFGAMAEEAAEETGLENFPVYHGSRQSPKIALTVDDCNDRQIVLKCVELCEKYGIAMTFFPNVNGVLTTGEAKGSLLREEDREIWRKVVDSGCEIGCHGYRHVKHNTNGIIVYSLMKFQEVLDQMLGYHYPYRWFRPPYGLESIMGDHGMRDSMITFKRCGYDHVMLWDVSYMLDAQGAFDRTQNGSILLFHAREADYECLEGLVPMLVEAGFERISVDMGVYRRIYQEIDEFYNPASIFTIAAWK